jgi:hypothetical protein
MHPPRPEALEEKMTSSRDLTEFLAGAGMILSGFSYLYWLRQVAREVNKTLPENKRLEWGLLERPRRTRWFWAQHEKLFPESRARAYAMLSIVLFFLIGVTAMTFILIADSR